MQGKGSNTHAGNTSKVLDLPYFVFFCFGKLKNPIEQARHISLPEAQLDRFMFANRIKNTLLIEEGD